MAAEQGFAMAQHDLGFLHRIGRGVRKDDAAALGWFRKAAEQDLPVAENDLGFMYQYGYGVLQDFGEALVWYRKAAGHGFALAQYNIGQLYDGGLGVSQDYGEAATWYRRAAEHGSAEAQYNLGTLFAFGHGVAQDDAEAARWYRKAADQGLAAAQNDLGALYQQGKGVAQNPAEALGWYTKAAGQGYALAQTNIGAMYQTGTGVAKDLAQSVLWYRRAVEGGSLTAAIALADILAIGPDELRSPTEAAQMYDLALPKMTAAQKLVAGFNFLMGRGVPQDRKKGAVIIEQAAREGSPDAMLQLSVVYADGLGVPPDLAASLSWLRAASDKGNAHAQALLGWRLEDGIGVGKDQVAALALIRASSEQGNSYGEALMGRFYQTGTVVPQDFMKAKELYEKSAGKDDIAGMLMLADLLIEGAPGIPPDTDRADRYLSRAFDIALKSPATAGGQLAIIARERAVILGSHGKFADAERLLVEAVEKAEASFGAYNDTYALILGDMADLYRGEGRYEDAAPLFARSIGIFERNHTLDSAQGFSVSDRFAAFKSESGDFTGAADIYAKIRGSSIVAKSEMMRIAIDAELGVVLIKRGDVEAGVRLLEPSVRGLEEKQFVSSPPVIGLRAEFAGGLAQLGRLEEAESQYRQVFRLGELAGLQEHPKAVPYLVEFAVLLSRLGKDEESASILRRVGELYAARIAHQVNASPATVLAERTRLRSSWLKMIDLVYKTPTPSSQLAGSLPETFLAAQAASTTMTGTAITQMAARIAAGNPAVQQMIRERRTLLEQWSALDHQMTGQMRQRIVPAGPEAPLVTTADLKAIERRVAEIDSALKKDLPAFFEFTSSLPVSLMDTQKALDPDEALLAYLIGEDETYVWAVTRSSSMVRKIEGYGAAKVSDLVARVRAGLDPSLAESAANLPKYDGDAAFDLYKVLVEPVKQALQGTKRLIIVPEGPLTSLPFHVLLSAPPGPMGAGFAQYRDFRWLAREFSMASVPSVSSFIALRKAKTAAAAPRPFVGFGDPLLDGDGSDQPTRGRRRPGPERRLAVRGVVDAAEVRKLAPLPETADELRRLANVLGNHGDVFLRGDATKTRVRAMDLSRYRVVAFATHGLVAGDLNGLTQPALVLSPPAIPTADDDGLLTAGDVAGLSLNADWVILSACNTAASDGRPGAEGLSGLARSFFIAGSRALLVSNWPVISDAALEVTVRTFGKVKASGNASRSEALRSAMMEVLDDPTLPAYMSHPAAWAPFVVIGEGG